MEKYEYEVGDVVTLKAASLRKQRLGNPAGGDSGFPLKWGCGHQVMTARRMVEKNTRALKRKVSKKVLHSIKNSDKITYP